MEHNKQFSGLNSDIRVQNINVEDLLKKLNKLYDQEQELIKQYKKLREDIELTQTMIMYVYNRQN